MRDIDALFENGHKGGIYFVLMNNLDFKNDRDIDSLLALTNFYQVLEAENYGNYSKDAFIRCTPILDNPILAKACFNYINEGAELPQVAAASVNHDQMLSGGFEKIDRAMVIPVGSTEQGDLVDFTLDTVSHIHCFIIGQSGTGKSVFLHDVIIGAMAKYSPEEFLVGVKYYQGTRSPNNAEREDIGYSTAWLHHKGRNKHHFEYWIDYIPEGAGHMGGCRMPLKYVAEMIADRYASVLYTCKGGKPGCPFRYDLHGFICQRTDFIHCKRLYV